MDDTELDDIGVCCECGDAVLDLINGLCHSCIDEMNAVDEADGSDWDDADPRQFYYDDPERLQDLPGYNGELP